MKLYVSKKIAMTVKRNFKIEDINELFQKYLDTKNQTDPDLIIRTAGNQRISNFYFGKLLTRIVFY